MEFGYEFPPAMEGVAEGAFIGGTGIVTGIFLIVYLIALGIGLVFYVLNAAGMYRIAKRRGIHHAWLAWIPIGCNWLLGSISDHYQYVAKQKATKKRKILLILSLILMAVSILLGVCFAALIAAETSGVGMGASILAVAMMVISYLAMAGLALAITVFCYIAYFDLFRSCRPDHDVLFLILSIFFGPAVFVFACSSYDKGMPPKRPAQQPPMQIPYEPEEPAEEEIYEEPETEEIPVVEGEIVEDPE